MLDLFFHDRQNLPQIADFDGRVQSIKLLNLVNSSEKGASFIEGNDV